MQWTRAGQSGTDRMHSTVIVNSWRFCSSHRFSNLDQGCAPRLNHPNAMAGDKSWAVDVIITNCRWGEYQWLIGSDASFTMPIDAP